MKIIKKSKMPDGTEIQIEYWKRDYDFVLTLNIAAYPIAKESNNFMIHRNEKFRLELLKFKSDDEVEEVFKKLENGEITLKECVHFFNDEKDIAYL